jgi:SP family general alpha glucoside:H+ symporter-like MFS transporter
MQFGSYHGAKIGYEISAGWQAALRQGAQIGSLFGVFIGAFMVDRWGYKITILSNLVFMCPIIGLVTFAPNLGALLAGEIILGLPWGVFSTLAEAYASEVCPIALRAYLTTCVNLAWVIGHLIGAGILRKSADMTGVWAFRMPFAVQWAWQVPLIAVLIFCPESPWWFVRKGKIDQAKRVLKRLAPSHEHDQIDDAVASMQRTNQMEIDNMEDSSWSSLFKGSDLRRTEISAVAWTIQIMCGLQFVNYSTYFFQQAGLETKNAFNMTIALYGAGLIGTLSSWFLLRYFGRRTIFVTGLFGLSIGQLLIGVLSVVADKGHNGARWGQAGEQISSRFRKLPTDLFPLLGLMVGWLLAYNLSVGPLAYVIVGEASSTRLRNKTVAFSRASYNLFSIVFGTLSPYMLNKTAWGWEGKVGFFWAPIAFCTFVWAYFRLPEMKVSCRSRDPSLLGRTRANFAAESIVLRNRHSFHARGPSAEVQVDDGGHTERGGHWPCPRWALEV